MAIEAIVDMESQVAEVWQCLERVVDPELDESITSMGFVESVKIDADKLFVDVEFRLPTYWCSPNFAFLMAFDIRTEVENLNWVYKARVKLNDHCFGERINEGVNGNHDFNAVFSEYGDGQDLNAVRVKFLEKAFVRRQEAVLLALEQYGVDRCDIVVMTLESLDSFIFDDIEVERQKKRYRTLLLGQSLAKTTSDLAFVTWFGSALSMEDFSEYLSQSRAVRINMEFNSALCRGLKESRYKEVQVGANEAMPIVFVPNATKATSVKTLN